MSPNYQVTQWLDHGDHENPTIQYGIRKRVWPGQFYDCCEDSEPIFYEDEADAKKRCKELNEADTLDPGWIEV